MNSLVNVKTRGGVAVVTIDNPPVNALSAGVPEGLLAALDTCMQDPAIQAMVIMGGGRTFPAGADINELQAAAKDPESAPDLHNVLAAFEASPNPIVMAIHGTALGGGLEIAMAGHYRVAVAEALIGAPEVNLGIIPGAEGTQRLPRLVGVEAAINLVVGGRPINAAEALKLGLIDRVIEGDLADGAVAFAQEIAGKPIPRTCDRNDRLGDAASNAPLFEAGRKLAAQTRPNQTAPLMAIEAIEIATTTPFAEGCKRERAMAKVSLATPQAQALIHLFFAERAVARVPDIGKDTKTYPVAKVGIIGAGIMGGGIAMACVNAGIPVLMKDTTQEMLDRGLATIRKNYDRSVSRGRMTAEAMQQRMAMIHTQVTYDGFENMDLIIEAAFEGMEIKRAIFGELDKIVKPDCVLASNTSTLDIDEIAGATSRPEMVIGLHFFSPANVMRLLEIVRGPRTSKEVVATALALAKTLKKVGVVVGNGFGFVGNRMMFPYMREAQFLVEEGALPQQVDAALTGFGMAMGIMAVDDMGGIDLLYRVRQEHPQQFAPDGVRRVIVHDKLYEAGRWGQKRSAGWYKYSDSPKPIPDPDVLPILEAASKEAGFERRAITNDEIVERCFYAMVNEGAKILDEGKASRAADIDVIYATGYGFPGWRGGPMWWADSVGLNNIVAKLREFEQRFAAQGGSTMWAPAPLLQKLAETGSTFAAWDAAKEQTRN